MHQFPILATVDWKLDMNIYSSLMLKKLFTTVTLTAYCTFE